MNYYVLFTRVLKQWDMTRGIKRELGNGRGTVFMPCTELWRNNSESTVIQPLFPGYIFIRSELGSGEMHGIIRNGSRDVRAFIKELRVGSLSSREKEEGDHVYGASFVQALRDDEAAFLDFLLDFRDGEGDSGSAGLIRMSKGYREGGSIRVMEGPLKGHEKHIIDINIRQRKAYLDIGINGHAARAGLEIFGKRHFFPDDMEAPELLSDGTELDTSELSKKMMGIRDNRGHTGGF